MSDKIENYWENISKLINKTKYLEETNKVNLDITIKYFNEDYEGHRLFVLNTGKLLLSIS